MSSQPAAKPPGWPEPVKNYVRRSFAPENLIPDVSREDMEKELKRIITQAAESGNIDATDWEKLPLPQQAIQQSRLYAAMAYHQPPQFWNQYAYPPANPAMASDNSPPGNNRKRSFEEQSGSSGPSTPPWRKSNNSGTGNFEDRITYSNKNQASRMEKRLKKQQAMEPSSKFQEELEKRRQRFDGNFNHHTADADDEQSPVNTGPVVGTSQETFKGYFRLTRQPRAHEVRPQPVLEKALDQLKAKWASTNDYNYICDQLKSIRQDLTVQHIKNAFTVKVYETHALIALEKGDLGEYNQCQTQLRALYSLKLGGRPAEFMAYRILYMIHTANRSGLNELLAELTPADKEKPAVKHALAVRSAIASGNYHKLFMLYHMCPNMGPYLMDKFVNRERLSAIAKICRAYVRQDLSLRFISEELGFDSYEDAAQFLIDQGAQDYLKVSGDSLILNTSAFVIFDQAQKTAFQKIDIKGQI